MEVKKSGEEKVYFSFCLPSFEKSKATSVLSALLQERVGHGLSPTAFPGAAAAAAAGGHRTPDFPQPPPHPYFPPPFASAGQEAVFAAAASAQHAAAASAGGAAAAAAHLDPYNVTNTLHNFQSSQVSLETKCTKNNNLAKNKLGKLKTHTHSLLFSSEIVS